MIRPLLLIISIVPVFVLGGCINRVAQPIDTHTQYVARTLVSPECLTKCDINADGLIQYWLWPGTALWPGHSLDEKQDREGKYYTIVDADIATAENDQGQERQKPEDGQPEDLEVNANAEFECWQQCRGPGMVATVPVSEWSKTVPMAGGALRRPEAAKTAAPVAESEVGSSVSESQPY